MLEFANEAIYEGAIIFVVATAVISYIYRFMEATFADMDRIVARFKRGERP